MRKRAAALIALIMILTAAVSVADVSVGDNVTFGNYSQHVKISGNPADPEPIVWRVLAVDGDKVLLLAEQPLVGMPYNSADRFLNDVTWETCSLRGWLNADFLNAAFSVTEQQAILPTAVSTPDYRDDSGFTVSGGNDTTDKVFLLSAYEAEQYLATKSSRKCAPTDYAVYFTGAGKEWRTLDKDSDVDAAYKPDDYTDNVAVWWLRSPGAIGHFTAYCNYDGEVHWGGDYSGRSNFSVRPAVWVSKSALDDRK